MTLLLVGSSRSFCLIGWYWFFDDDGFELGCDVDVDLGWCWAIWGNGVLLLELNIRIYILNKKD